MKSIFTYNDYRSYLRDAILEKQRKNGNFSLRSAATRIGITSGSLTRILNGSRHAGSSLCEKCIAFLGLKRREAEFFTLLVKFESAGSETARRDCYGRIQRMRTERNTQVPHEHYRLFEQWYHIALLELLKTVKKCPSYDELGARLTPPISGAKARKACGLLEKLGYVNRAGDGSVSLAEPFLTTGDTWQSTAIHGFQVAMARHGAEALDTVPKPQRDYSTLTMALTPDALEKIRAIIKQARADIALVEQNCSDPDRVYQINFQCFPLSAPSSDGQNP